MTYQFDPNRPIYIQVMEDVKRKITSNEYKPRDKILPVREMASEYAINPNTVQKALSELEREKIVYSQRTNGRYITEDEQIIFNLKKEMIAQRIDSFLLDMKHLGFSKEEIIKMIQEEIL